VRNNDQNPFFAIGYQYHDINRMDTRTINAVAKSFAYSAKDELTSVSAGQGAPLPPAELSSYQYDLNGNRLVSSTTNNQIPATKNYAHDANGRVTSDGTFTYSYDDEGNLLAQESVSEKMTLGYDAEGRLVSVQKFDKNGATWVLTTSATYAYDPMGRRISKTIILSPISNIPSTTFYHSNAFGLCGEYDSTGNLLKSYGYAPGSGWSTDPLFMKVVSPPAGSGQSAVFSYLYFHNDALGTPHALTDKAGQIVWSAQYDEFGAAQIASTGGTSSTSSVVCNLRFPGQYFDTETGLHYNFHRYYDPALGRYITEDPIRDGLNWYAYAGSNPGNNIDPEGLATYLYLIGQPLSPEQKAGMSLAGKSRQIAEIENINGEIADQTQKVQVGIVMKVLPESWHTPTGRAMVLFALGMIQPPCRNAPKAAKTTKEIKTRPTKGADGGTSEHIIERDASGDVISMTHRVETDGKVVHQHQDHQGKHGGERRFPDEWVEYPEVNAPPHVPRPAKDNSITD